MTKLLEKDLVYKIVGCAMKVHSGVGPGLREKTYEKGLCVEFDFEGVDFDQQVEFPVHYRGEKIDEFIPDLIVKNKVVVEIKTVESIHNDHRGQVLTWIIHQKENICHKYRNE